MGASSPRGRVAAALAVALLAMVPVEAWAYLDPATGSAMLQAVVGGLLAGLFVVKRYWRQLVARFTRSRARRPAGADAQAVEKGRSPSISER